MEIGKVFERIKLSRDTGELDVALLNEICIAFTANIPFDTFDVIAGHTRTLSMKSVYDILVVQNRGGICYELNLLLYWLLTTIGYKVDLCMGYLEEQKTGKFESMCAHMVLVVHVGNEKYLADIAWSNSFMFPLNLDHLDTPQEHVDGVYRITYDNFEKIYRLQKKRQTEIGLDGVKKEVKHNSKMWVTTYGFQTHPCKLEDFQEAFKYAFAKHPFTTNNSIAAVRNKKGRKFLIGNTLVEKRYVNQDTIKVFRLNKIEGSQMKEVLMSEFDIRLDFNFQPKSEVEWKYM